MYISDKSLIKFIIDCLESRNFEISDNAEQYKFSFVTTHCNPSFQIPKTDSASSFRDSFMDLPSSFDLSDSEHMDSDQIQHILSKTVKFVNDIYTVAQDYNASIKVGA